MSAARQRRRSLRDASIQKLDEGARVPEFVNSNGDKVVTITDDLGREQTCVVAELVLKTFVGPRPPGHVVRFKNGDRMDARLVNVEWVAS